ncbi:pilus assembly protein CpaE [Bacillus mesophilus]|uniref:AAA family ATPase n=1 Tax=Bacillus mesophilus TaxID=1808955 RepID=A0A6M0Q7I1_9BACI|nr:AAA family ATPase [Bacillus mesophilus]MBM7661634.1 pilus assembly protein CpaE [Bacillus mesophilus]NEY72302.1 AAA family ATPase [Bacillus mesophilus]
MKTRVIYYTNHLNVITQIQQAADELKYPLTTIQEMGDIKKNIKENEHTVVFIEANSSSNIYELCKKLNFTYPNVGIVLVGREEELDLRLAIRSGAVDVLFISADQHETVEVMERAVWELKKAQNQVEEVKELKEKRTITVCSTKGGVGKTTIVVNLAAELAKQKYKVVILDLNLQFGDVAMFCDIKPKRTIYEWTKEQYGNAHRDISRFVQQHESGVDIIPAPLRPEFAEAINENHIRAILLDIQESYDVVLIDTPVHLSEIGIISLEMSTDILVTTFMDLPTIKNTKIYVDTLDSLGLKDKIKVILNRAYKVKGIEPETVEKILGKKLFSRVPNKEKQIVMSVNEGKPFVLTNPRNPFSKNIKVIAKKLMDDKVTNKSKDSSIKEKVEILSR